MNEEDVLKLAHLARLHLEPNELSAVAEKLGSILSYIKKLDAVNVDGVEAMSHVHGVQNVFRADVAQPSLSIEDALLNAPDKSGRFIKVPIIIEQEG
jgi:aspartyl-tRNA(Asn)/glutamyl-tRNA(Gln) amidotransferase subunit C